ncbi:MAG: DUF1080 domain-containing protein [Acidobacteriota bacterium]
MRNTFLLLSALLLLSAAPRAQQANPFLGQWNITGTGTDSNQIFWLELKDEGGKISSLFLNRTSHPVPLTAVKIENGELLFQVSGTREKPTGPEYHAKVVDGKLVGSHTVTPRPPAAGATPPATPPAPRTINWVGVRPPVWPAANANGKHEYGAPVVLYDETMKDKDPATLFDVQNTRNPINWLVEDGLLTNKAPGGNNIISKQKFTDFKVHVEYKLEPKSNSGIYLRGRYELQVLDDINDTTTEKYLTQAAIYGRRAPDVLASKAPGEWQVMEAVMVANKVTVTLNGKTVHDNQPVVGVTGGTLDNDELAPGPLMIQGDHGRVWIRRAVVTPITKTGK